MEAMAFVILVLGLVAATVWRSHLRESQQIRLREIVHQERVKAMERDLPLPELERDDVPGPLSLRSRPGQWSASGLATSVVWVRLVTLGLGLTLLLGGVGTTVGLYWIADSEVQGTWPMGLIPVFTGVGLLMFYSLSRRFVVAPEDRGSEA